MFCSNCGNQLPEGTLFCQECGEKVNGEETATDQTEKVMPNAENSYETNQDRLNREKQLKHYKEMSQEMLENLKKVPYQGMFDRLKNMPLKWKIGAGIGILLVIVVCTRIHKPGEGVRDAYLESYSNSITVEEAFDSFFDNGKWSEHKEDGDVYVVFTGECTYLDKKADIKIRFRIKGDHFYFANMEMNGQPQSDIVSEALLDKVYEGYY